MSRRSHLDVMFLGIAFGVATGGAWLSGCGASDEDHADEANANNGDASTGTTPSTSDDASSTDAASPGAEGGDTGSPDEDAPPPGIEPTLFQPFDGWSGNVSPDGVWRIAGTWVGTGGNTLEPKNAAMKDGLLLLTSKANTKSGAEIQTLEDYGYGYYEVRMQVTAVSGVCASFFWIEGGKDSYGPHEWDVEFLTNELSSDGGAKVHFTIHPKETSIVVDLPFHPSKALHRYGFLWKPGTIDFTADGTIVKSMSDPSLETSVKGVIMMNSWTSGDPNWGGGPPKSDATTSYDWVKYYDGATTVP